MIVIQSTIAINFEFSKDPDEERVMHSRNNNIKFISYKDANEVLDELFDSIRSRYQGNLKTWMRVNFKVNFRHDDSYIDSPDWIKKKKATINSKKTDDKCFQYPVIVALTY